MAALTSRVSSDANRSRSAFSAANADALSSSSSSRIRCLCCSSSCCSRAALSLHLPDSVALSWCMAPHAQPRPTSVSLADYPSIMPCSCSLRVETTNRSQSIQTISTVTQAALDRGGGCLELRGRFLDANTRTLCTQERRDETTVVLSVLCCQARPEAHMGGYLPFLRLLRNAGDLI